MRKTAVMVNVGRLALFRVHQLEAALSWADMPDFAVKV